MGNVLIFNRDYQSKKEVIKAKKPLSKLVRKLFITYKKYSSPNEKFVRVTMAAGKFTATLLDPAVLDSVVFKLVDCTLIDVKPYSRLSS